MHSKTRNRLIFWCIAVLSIFLGVSLILFNLSDSLSFFITPTILKEKNIKFEVKLGGYVKSASVKKIDIDNIEFIVTDKKNEVKVKFMGPIPLIFREEQGVVVTGIMQDNEFIASELLAKHDEKYMPKNIKPKI